MIDLYTIFYWYLLISFALCFFVVIFGITCLVVDWLRMDNEEEKK